MVGGSYYLVEFFFRGSCVMDDVVVFGDYRLHALGIRVFYRDSLFAFFAFFLAAPDPVGWPAEQAWHYRKRHVKIVFAHASVSVFSRASGA